MNFDRDDFLKRAIAHQKSGQTEIAENAYRELIRTRPSDPIANHNLGIIEMERGNVEESLVLFREALSYNSKNEQFWITYIESLVKAQKFETAMNVIRKAEEAGFASNYIKSLFHKGMPLAEYAQSLGSSSYQVKAEFLLSSFNSGPYEQTKALALEMISEFPGQPLPWKVLGALFLNSGRIEDAISAFKEVTAVAPEDAEAHSNLGNSLKAAGRLLEAEQSYLRSIDCQADFATAHFNLGVLYFEQGQLENAKRSFKDSLRIEPGNSDAHFNLGEAFKTLGDIDAAVKCFNMAAEAEPNNPRYNSIRGVTAALVARPLLSQSTTFNSYLDNADWTGSKEYLQQLFFRNPNHIAEYVDEFINLWVNWCSKNLKKLALAELSGIFASLVRVGERNKNLEALKAEFFKNFLLEEVLISSVKRNHPLLKLAYAEYKGRSETLNDSESLTLKNIVDAKEMIENKTDENLGWSIIRRSLSLLEDKRSASLAIKKLAGEIGKRI